MGCAFRMHHVHTFNMDEYADQDGNTAPADWAGSFQTAMMENFFQRIDPELRPPLEQIHFPTTANINDYGTMIEDLAGRMFAMAALAGAVTLPSGNQIWARNSAMIWRPTCRQDPASSN